MPPVIAASVFALLTWFFITGCGSDTTQTDESPPATANINRPAPGTVEIIDSLNDISASDPNLSSAPSFLDINRASISKDGNKLKFTIESAAPLPEAPQQGTAVEWGFLLDVDQNGTPDWGIFADLTAKDGWLPGVYDQKTKLRTAGPQFPGSLTHTGTTLVLTVESAAIGDPAAFKWFAYSDAALAVSGMSNQKAGDKIWDPASPDNSENWLSYP